ncbi:MAG: FIG004453: protein YceG like [uncultured Nocardioidaceae bacterium]|uniref:Endolytic murein transglycosylase n=1 Tax=uncultured Nocardioidaceae bacterium TaxID=253824 RepID=A0A6J4N4I6_9ACTN|nr:MAG: FIG004453: protein YceG like [uncultured Nocardioidaceae bacterium]
MNDDRAEQASYQEDAPGSLFERPDDYDEPAVGPPRGRRWASCLIVLVVLALLGAGAYALVSVGMDRVSGLFEGPEDFAGEGSGSVVFEVNEGDSSSAIGRNLKAQGVVASVEAFTEAAAENPDSTTIQVGFYELRKRMSAESALDVLVDPDNLVQSSATVPEGLRVEDTIKVLAKETDIPVAKFEQALDDPKSIGLPAYAKGNAEGYLFPATYAFPPNADAPGILSAMVDRWEQAADEAGLEERASELGYTPGELMIVASLVESEANRDEDRGKVARVIYNRLETDATNGLLQIDATVNYALGRDLGLGLTPEQLEVDDPYNTRIYPGLPPGPIESPGDKAIEAAANPPEGNWVYYVTVNLDTGETKFTDDYDEFLQFKNVELAAYCDSSDRC